MGFFDAGKDAEADQHPFAGVDITALFGDLPAKIASATVEAQVKRERAKPASQTVYDGRSINIPQDEVIGLLPYHAGRVRFFVKATAANVLIGDRNNLSANSGWLLTTTGSLEFETIQEVYVKSVGAPSTVYVWVEYISE